MSTQETMNGQRTSYDTTGKMFSSLKRPRSSLEFALMRGVTDFTNLPQFNAYETGYGYLIVIDAPQFIKLLASKDDNVKNLLDIYIKTLENEFKGLSGLGSFSAESSEISDGIVSISMINKTNFEASGTFSMTFTEKTGTPLSKFNEICLRGIKDPKTQFKTYYGELEADYSLEAGLEKECFTFLYLVTDNTGRELERAMLLTGCQPQSVPYSELYESEKGNIANVEITLEFSYHLIESAEINRLAREALDWLNNDVNINKIIKNGYEKQYIAVEEKLKPFIEGQKTK